VVAVGVPDFFFACGWIGLLIFLRNEKKQCANSVWIVKNVTKKTTAGLIVRKPTIRPCKPRCTRGEDFCLPGTAPAELPVINFYAKPARLLSEDIVED